MRHNYLAAALSLVAVSIGSPTGLHSAPLFYLSDQPLGVAQPGTFSLSNPVGGTTGQLNIYAMTDVRLAGVSLDLLENSGGIKFTGLDVVNDGRWWILDGPRVIEDSKISSIGGGAIPGMSGNGIGPGDFVDANFHSTSGYLMATVDYEVVDASLSSNFELKVGCNTIADWQGGSPMVHFNDYLQLAVPGKHPDLPTLTNPPPPQPQPPVSDPVRPDPAPSLNQPGFVDPPRQREPVGADPGDFIGSIDAPLPMPLDWRVVVISNETIQRPTLLVPPDLQDEYEMWIAAERSLVLVSNDSSYINHFGSMPTRENPSYLHSAAQLFTGEADLALSRTNELPVAELFHDTAALSLFGTLAEAGSLQLTPSVPEPATMALSGLTFLALLGLWRRRLG
jgi:PEP-CTERM motif-containing protein